MMIEHRRYAVEAVAVEVVFVEPVFDVREQEVLHLALAVVEDHRVPIGLVTGLPGFGVEVVGAVERGYALVEVLDVVGVHQIHDYPQPERVRTVDERFKLLGRTEARRGCEQTRYVVAERAVIGVFGHGHELYGVVALLLYKRQYAVRKFAIGAYALTLLRHARVGLVDEQRLVGGTVSAVVPYIWFGRPELRREILRRLVLHHAPRPCRDAVVPAVGTVDVYLVERAVDEPAGIHRVGQEYAPHAVAVLVEPQLRALPRVEVAEQIDVGGLGQPLAEPPARHLLVSLPAEVAVSVGIVDDRAGRRCYVVEPAEVHGVPTFELSLDGFEPRVGFDDGQTLFLRFHIFL